MGDGWYNGVAAGFSDDGNEVVEGGAELPGCSWGHRDVGGQHLNSRLKT